MLTYIEAVVNFSTDNTRLDLSVRQVGFYPVCFKNGSH